MVVVMDNSQFRRAGSIDATIFRAMTIVNHANALLKRLDIYIVVISIEIWNDYNKIPYVNHTEYPKSIDHGKLLNSLIRYRQYKLNWNLPNDNIQLLSASDFAGNIIGLGSTEGICSQAYNGGITSDTIEDNPIRAASTMAHEFGHNLGLGHSDDFEDEACQCEDPIDPEFTNCIMHSSASGMRCLSTK
ncbi:ADAM8 [Bugula neritina]|uniref:ADAM8 n=1 Tax=Bugula neritina TaxID=10212 RepID=A0A7J7JBT0_BUGNE|nr:ADAM8 [Bugula neritina]KAF6038008.1 ADAM8 [Bugula neritina]